ncbi:MAG: hypothetical protein AB7R89_23730 [Dehalococcoidia bacterium]
MSVVRATGEPAVGAAEQAEDDRLIGGEVEAGSGRAPGFFRWLNIGLYVAAIMYLILNRVESYAILLVLAVALTAWTIYFATQKKPPEP